MSNNSHYPSIQPVYFPEHNRRKSLEKYLEYYYGADWQKSVRPSVVIQTYVDRIHSIGKHRPELLISHIYARYMGDLSGGQILKKIAKSAMQLSGDRGTEFYVFRDISSEKDLKNIYRDALNLLPVSDRQISLIIAEANVAFNLNMRMFQELNSSLVKIMIMLLSNAVSNLRNIF